MYTVIRILLTVFCFHQFSCTPEEIYDVEYERVKQVFINPPQSAKPKVYWWCLNGNIDTTMARKEFFAMKAAGIGGFDMFEIGVPKQDTMIPGGPAFLSDESVQTIKFVVEQAGKLGLSVGLNVASSWNAGGSWIKPEHGGKSLYVSKVEIVGNGEEKNIVVPFPDIAFPKESLIGGTNKPMIPFQPDGRPEYYEEVVVLAIPANGSHYLDTAQVVNVTPFFHDGNGILTWKAPPGKWEIHRYICSNSGQQLVLPSPLSAGLTVDHFDSVAVETHLQYVIDRLQPVLGDFRKTALKSLYLASYEARGFVWTSSMASEFKKLNNYEILKFIPGLFESELFPRSITEKVQSDFKRTLSELMINNLYRKSREVCNRVGLQINCEAGGPGYPLYNGPAEPLKALGALDIPRGEFWVNHGRFYKDDDSKDSIDILRVVKEVAAASHIYQKGIVEEEAFTSFQHWQEGPADIKPFGDRAFCEGMNRVVFHGFSHNPAGSGSPGIVYHAGTHINTKRVWWPMVKPFIDYVSRLSAVFQETEFVADVLWYYGDQVPNAVTPKNTHFSIGPGYDYEAINTEILLNDLEVVDGAITLGSGATFSMLVIEDHAEINPLVLLKLKHLASKGAVITGKKPQRITLVGHSPLTLDEGKEIIDELWKHDPNLPNELKAKVTAGIAPVEILQRLGLGPDFKYPDSDTYLLDYIHYQKEDLDFYFVCNTSNQWVSRSCSFRQQNSIPEIWNPNSGTIVPVTIFDQHQAYLEIPITLAPFGSQLIVIRKGNPVPHYTAISDLQGHPPKIIFTDNGFIATPNGDFELTNNGNAQSFRNTPKSQTLKGPWHLQFQAGWGAPEQVELPKLTSWTESETDGIKYFSGVASYTKKFSYAGDSNRGAGEAVFLDLGDLSKIAEVWLNDVPLGVTWTKPFSFEVTDHIISGENTLRVEVANCWSNRLTGDAVLHEAFTSTNIESTVLPTEGMETSDQSRVPWANVPLIQSGLLGPVRIVSYETILPPG